MRGFFRDALHGGPGTAVEFIPVGGKLIWKASKEIVLRLLRTDMEKWGDELEKWIYKDIQVEYECPKCGQKWTETHPLSESEYKQVIADYITKVTDLVTLKKAESKKIENNKLNTVMNNQESIGMNMSLQIPYKELEAFVMKRKLDQEKIGRCHILIDPETDTGMIGWFLRKEFWGQQFAMESGEALIRYCFDELGLHRVNAFCHPGNLASRKVLERCGLRQEAWFRQKCRYVKDGISRWEDELEYAVLASEWAAARDL